jgi:hypothetical protein
MEEEKLKLTVKLSSGKQFDVEVSKFATVPELKDSCVEGSGIIAAE